MVRGSGALAELITGKHGAVKRASRGTRKKNCRTERFLLGFNNFDRQL
jgi:hypothetical protein